MRVLLTSYSEATHFLGMVPLGWALKNAGHDVRVASQPGMTDVIADTGLTAVPMGREHGLDNRMIEVAAKGRMARGAAGNSFFGDPFGWTTRQSWQGVLMEYSLCINFWLRPASQTILDDLVRFCRSWQPDLVIWEPLTYAGAIAAKACGAVHARHLWGLDMMPLMQRQFLMELERQRAAGRPGLDVLQQWLSTCAKRAGVTYDDEIARGHFTIDYVPDELRLDDIEEIDRVPMRYIPYNGRSVLPEWLREPPTRPRICLTMGSVRLAVGESLTDLSLDDLFSVLSEFDAEVVTALTSAQTRTIRKPVPENVRLVDFTPLHALLPTCSGIIHHGGVGTLFTSSHYGVPQLVLPQLIPSAVVYDEGLLAQKLMDQGAGLTVPGERMDREALREAIGRLLYDDSLRRRARQIAEGMADMPSPDAVAQCVEALVERHRGGVDSRSQVTSTLGT